MELEAVVSIMSSGVSGEDPGLMCCEPCSWPSWIRLQMLSRSAASYHAGRRCMLAAVAKQQYWRLTA